MFASIRHAVARTSLRRAANIRTLTDSAVADAVKETAPDAGEIGLASIAASPSALSAASSSTPVAANAAQAAADIHIPPAEDPLLHLLTSLIMRHGKRQEAARATTKMLLHLHAFTQAPPLPLLRQAVVTAQPFLRCRQFKRAAKQFVFPMPLSERQRTRTALEWILDASDKKGGKHLPERLAREVVAVLKGDSTVLKKKEEVHKLAVLHRGNVLRPPRVPRSNKV
ncbi:ribosomal protein S7 [Lenzites betulinus]|nr:ribosomal protein S7 [Lenzites betulinus]